MPDSRIITLGILLLAMLLFAVMLYRKDRKNTAYALLVGTVGLWAFAILNFSLASHSAEFWGRVSYMFGSSIAVLFCLFSLVYTNKRPNIVGYAALFFPLALVVLLDLFTGFFIESVTISGTSRSFIFGNLRFLLDVHFVLYFGYGFFVFYRHFQKETDLVKRRWYLFIIVGALAGLFLPALTNTIFPLVGRPDLLWAGHVGAGVWAVFLAYRIVKGDLLDTRIITMQIFVSILLIVFFAHIFEFHVREQLAFNLFLFGITAALGMYLMRSVTHESEQRKALRELSEKLQQANEDLRKLDESKSEFISIASHQMRTPLSTSKGYVSILMEGTFGKLSAGQIEALHKIYVTNERLIKLVDDLLSLSQIEAGKIIYDFKKTDFVETAKEVIEEASPFIEKKHLRIILTPPSFPVPYVLADAGKIRQVIQNCIDNAVRYTDKGGAEVRFYETKVDGRPYLGMIVEDSGRGIDKDDLVHLFTKFTRSERTRKLYTEGTGLGLYVAKKIVDDHNGRIYARSEGVGKGSSFYVELPIARG
ncbi:MAG: hypothetical protein HYW88_01740 [Candidatus Sungbacteria bacterium]|nr:hypothetical protein [Candidatus Sungbacteria bacterium]